MIVGGYDASDGKFQVTNKFMALFNSMGREEEKWMRECSVVVDCVYAVLGNGGILE